MQYNPEYFKVTTDEAGRNKVPSSQNLASFGLPAAGGCLLLYLWGVADTTGAGNLTVALDYSLTTTAIESLPAGTQGLTINMTADFLSTEQAELNANDPIAHVNPSGLVSGRKTTVIVGQYIDLMVYNLPLGATGEWSIGGADSGQAVGGYKPSVTSAVVKPIQGIKTTHVAFCWIAAGTYTVTYTETMGAVKTPITANFIVVAPEATLGYTSTNRYPPVQVTAGCHL